MHPTVPKRDAAAGWDVVRVRGLAAAVGVPGHCLQQALRDLDEACRRHGTFGVHWRSVRRWSPSFRFPEGSKMKLEKLRSATLTREGEEWFISFRV